MSPQSRKNEVTRPSDSRVWEQVLGTVPVMVLLLMILMPVGTAYLYYPISEWLSYRAHRQRFDSHYERSILPGAAWVRRHMELHGRLPSQEEYRASRKQVGEYRGSALMTAADQHPSWSIAGDNFMIAGVDGEWNLYYQSWDGKRFWHYTE